MAIGIGNPAGANTLGSRDHKTLTIGIAQVTPQLGDVAANLEIIEQFVQQAAGAEVDLLVFPELALTGYPVGSWFSSASITARSPELARLKELSRAVAMVVGVIEETEETEFFNTAVFLRDGRVEHLHRKVYLPTYRQFDERRYFMAGWTVNAFDAPWCRMASLICGDCWHLSLPYLAVHDGADVLVVLAASSEAGLTEAISSRDAWERMNRSYALTLSTFVVFANLVGEMDGVHFWGGSHVVGPAGDLLAQANFENQQLLIARLDLQQLRNQRLILPFRRDDSLALTTELGREILLRKSTRTGGLRGEPTFPPVGVSDLSFGEPAEPAAIPSTDHE